MDSFVINRALRQIWLPNRSMNIPHEELELAVNLLSASYSTGWHAEGWATIEFQSYCDRLHQISFGPDGLCYFMPASADLSIYLSFYANSIRFNGTATKDEFMMYFIDEIDDCVHYRLLIARIDSYMHYRALSIAPTSQFEFPRQI